MPIRVVANDAVEIVKQTQAQPDLRVIEMLHLRNRTAHQEFSPERGNQLRNSDYRPPAPPQVNTNNSGLNTLPERPG